MQVAIQRGKAKLGCPSLTFVHIETPFSTLEPAHSLIVAFFAACLQERAAIRKPIVAAGVSCTFISYTLILKTFSAEHRSRGFLHNIRRVLKNTTTPIY